VIVCKRVYLPASADDGYRVLVDRLWPRGCRKEEARLDAWLRELGPSDPVRRAFAHDPARFPAFREAYRAELAEAPALWQPLLERARSGTLTLLYGAHDEEHNNARVLAEFLAEQLATAISARGETP
jgi:uncharacterized protein YeaO (DUF488 family)